MHKNNVLERIRIGRPPFGGSVKHECNIRDMPAETAWGILIDAERPTNAKQQALLAARTERPTIAKQQALLAARTEQQTSNGSAQPAPSGGDLDASTTNAVHLIQSSITVGASVVSKEAADKLAANAAKVKEDYETDREAFLEKKREFDAYWLDANVDYFPKLWEWANYKRKNAADIKRFANDLA